MRCGQKSCLTDSDIATPRSKSADEIDRLNRVSGRCCDTPYRRRLRAALKSIMHPVAPGRTQRVLIVDDEVSVVEGLRAAFELDRRPVVISSGFHDAHKRLVEEEFDVLITDVRLGAFNGLQLAVIARDRNPDMGIIVFSGYDDPVLQAEAERLRARYLVKPVSIDRLLDVIATL